MTVTFDTAAQAYVDGLTAAQRPLFDRVTRLVGELPGETTVVISYAIPTFVREGRRLHVGAWKHGLSFYGWKGDNPFVVAHPELLSTRSTLKLSPQAAAGIADEELRTFLRVALAA